MLELEVIFWAKETCYSSQIPNMRKLDVIQEVMGSRTGSVFCICLWLLLWGSRLALRFSGRMLGCFLIQMIPTTAANAFAPAAEHQHRSFHSTFLASALFGCHYSFSCHQRAFFRLFKKTVVVIML